MISERKGQGMKHITAEQFREQPEEVQEVFYDWWKPTTGDLNYGKKYGMAVIERNDLSFMDNEDLKGVREYNTPLFTLQQLWEFIEDKTNYPVTVSFLTDEYWIDTDDGWSGDEKCFYDEDKLQAFWKCACEVARIIR